MDILIGKRQQGKTTRLIELSAAGKGTIVAPTEQSAEYIKEQAKAMKLNIPEPISWNRLTEIGGGGYGGAAPTFSMNLVGFSVGSTLKPQLSATRVASSI